MKGPHQRQKCIIQVRSNPKVFHFDEWSLVVEQLIFRVYRSAKLCVFNPCLVHKPCAVLSDKISRDRGDNNNQENKG